MQSGARFSTCKTYRYALWRQWSDLPLVLFVMLNPSTADETRDDPTIRRCISLARQWGYGGCLVGNLFALRSPYPADLKRAVDPVGIHNDRWLKRLARRSDAVVGAWGNHGSYMRRGEMVAKRLPGLMCLGLTKAGQPRHPLYVRADTQLVPFA